MQEMAYEDARWVRFLKRMGCWDEMEARKPAEQALAQSHNRPRGASLYMKKAATQSQRPGSAGGAGKQTKQTNGHSGDGGDADDAAGFDAVGFDTSTNEQSSQHAGRNAALTALRRVHSTRGKAREEYGKVHAALSPFYEDLVRTDVSTDCKVFKLHNTPEEQAQLLSQLQAFARCDFGAASDKRVGKVSDAVSLFETAALREFKSGYESGDTEGQMQKYAHVLVLLNGGSSAVELFIHHNRLITKKPDFGSPADAVDSSTGAVSLAQTQAFLARLGVAFNEEASIISKCFPKATDLAAPFLDKVGKGIISPYFGTLFDEVHSSNIKSYLEAVSGTFAQCINFAQNLHPIQTSGEDGFVEAATQTVEDVFELHVDLYLAEELDQFRKHSDAVVEDWDRQLSEQAASTESFFMSNVNRQKDKKDFLTSFRKVVMAPVNILPSFSTKTSSTTKPENPEQQSSKLDAPNNNTGKRLSGLPPPGPVTPPTKEELPTTELAAKAAIMNSKLEGIKSLFSIDVALNLVHSAKSSLERAARFVQFRGQLGKAAKQQCEAIFVSLLTIVGHRHVIGGFDKAVDHLSEYRPRRQTEEVKKTEVEPLVTFLELVNVGDLILQMMDVFYEQELIGTHLTDRSDFLDPAVKEKKKFEQLLDGRVAAGLNKGIDVLIEEVDYILATRQTAEDFNPGSTDAPSTTGEIGPSEVAQSVVQVASTHTQMLVGSTDKSTLDVFNQEVGLRLFTSLCKHLKRQRISVEGSIKLIRRVPHTLSLFLSLSLSLMWC